MHTSDEKLTRLNNNLQETLGDIIHTAEITREEIAEGSTKSLVSFAQSTLNMCLMLLDTDKRISVLIATEAANAN